MSEVKKITVRFNLENDLDNEIWEALQKKKNKNDFIKKLLLEETIRKDEHEVLNEVKALRKLLEEIRQKEFVKTGSLESDQDKQEEKAAPVKQEDYMEQVAIKEESFVIDADVMNFLDHL